MVVNQVRPLVRNTLYVNTIQILVRFENSYYFLIADRNNLSLNSMKKRQRTKKFPMTAGSWTGPEGPTGKNCTVSSGVALCLCVLIILSYIDGL